MLADFAMRPSQSPHSTVSFLTEKFLLTLLSGDLPEFCPKSAALLTFFLVSRPMQNQMVHAQVGGCGFGQRRDFQEEKFDEELTSSNGSINILDEDFADYESDSIDVTDNNSGGDSIDVIG